MKQLFTADTRLKTVIIILLAVAILTLLVLTARNLQGQSRNGAMVGDEIKDVTGDSLEHSANVEGSVVDTTATPTVTDQASPSGVIIE